MGEAVKLLKVDDVATILGIPENAAYEVMNALPHVRIGKRIRVHPDVLDKWMRKGGDAWQRSTSERAADTCGAGGETPAESAGSKAPTRPNLVQLNSRLQGLRERKRLEPIKPRARQLDSKKPS